MGESPDTARPLAGILSGSSSGSSSSSVVAVGCWGTEAAACAALASEGVARVTQSLLGTTFSVGRNRNQELVGGLELAQGHLFEYIAHWDEDMLLLGACGVGAEPSEALLRAPMPSELRGGVGPVTPVEVGGGAPTEGAPCARALEAWVLALAPAIAVPNLGYPLPGPYAWQRVYNFDSQSTFFHRRAVDALLPYDTPFERYSYYSGPSAMQHLAGTLYWGAVVAVNLVYVHNPRHRSYAKGVGQGMHCSMGIRWFQEAEGLVPPSGLGLVRWDCAPDGIGEGVEAAAAAWGSLSWVEGRGRFGAWPGAAGGAGVQEVSAAGVADFGATGAVGGAPRAAPPYAAAR